MPQHVECSCDDCNSACRSPGALMPTDVVHIAAFLNSSEMQLVGTKLQKDVGSNILRPMVKRGWCTFYKKNVGCTIHAVKPFECREYYHRDTCAVMSARTTYIHAAWLASQQDKDNENAE